jgi:D-beta-D-heptose 7-phosphate kinase / D-beta-D-heptose 1-phosphate adenosyltransferase
MNSALHHDAIELLENGWHGRRVLIVGDVMLDKYIHGTVHRISPEAPVPVLSASRLTHCPGGAANVAMNIAGLGATATLIGFVGEDENAKTLLGDLVAAGVDAALVALPEFPTTCKLRVLSCNQQMLRIDFEKVGTHQEEAYQQLVQRARDEMATCAAVVISDYAKGALSDSVCAAIIKDAHALGVPVLVDPKSPSFEKYRGATTVCPNLNELSAVGNGLPGEIEKLFDFCGVLLERHSLEFITVTLGERGIAVIGKGWRKRASAVARQVFDVSGAGDTVIATLALCLASDVEIGSAIELANLAAGIVIGKAGTVPIERGELTGVLSAEMSLHTSEKIIPEDRLHARLAAWRATGQRIVLTNGCFDLLHVGHISLLERAHLQGDRLIVAINSDSSVSMLKGPGRPVVAEQERAKVLAALSTVDAVVIFDGITPLKLIRAVRPDVLVKGGDYTEEEVVGGVDVRSWGGRVCLVPLVDGFSTSGLIAEAARTVGA